MNEQLRFPGRLGLQQRVLPQYRAAFFDELASRCSGGLSVYAGHPRTSEAIDSAQQLETAEWAQARNVHLFGGPLYLCLQPGIVDWLQRTDPAALVLEANPRYLSSQRAISWMVERGRPVIGWGLGAPGWSPWRNRMLSRLEAVIAYSSVGAASYRAVGIPDDRVHVAPNAVTGPPPPLERSARDPNRAPSVLFVGRLQPRKRIDLLLRACQAMPKPLELSIVGDGPARQSLQAEAQQVFPAARFHGAMRGPALEAVFEAADVFVLPGTGGLAVQQAMAHGLPVIVAEADGSQADLVTAENGWTIEAGDLADLTNALRQALSDPARLRAMGAESHRIASERVNIEAMADVFIRVVNRAAGR